MGKGQLLRVRQECAIIFGCRGHDFFVYFRESFLIHTRHTFGY